MARGFAKSTATLAAATATSLAAVLVAEGYTGSMIGKYLRIDAGALADLFRGADSAVSAATGIPVTTAGGPFVLEAGSQEAAIDPGSIWLFSTGGGDFSLTFQPF